MSSTCMWAPPEGGGLLEVLYPLFWILGVHLLGGARRAGRGRDHPAPHPAQPNDPPTATNPTRTIPSFKSATAVCMKSIGFVCNIDEVSKGMA